MNLKKRQKRKLRAIEDGLENAGGKIKLIKPKLS